MKHELKGTVAVILGGYINGYSIVRELYEQGIPNIVLIDTKRNVASFSNKLTDFIRIKENTPENLESAFSCLHPKYSYLVTYPTNDLYVENLFHLRKKIGDYCFLPFNHENIIETQDKMVQYRACEKLGVPYPQTIEIKTISDITTLKELPFPIIIKPRKRDDLTTDVFRSLILEDRSSLPEKKAALSFYIDSGTTFIASEIIPGPCSELYSHVCYRNQEGKILGDWIGKKLSQFPNTFGVVSTGSNQAPEVIREQGVKLMNGMDLMSMCQNEFKYDERDGKYKLMEINTRSMMWNRMGVLCGVNLHHLQYLDAIGKKTTAQKRNQSTKIHFFNVKHELINLLTRRGYSRTFWHNLTKGETLVIVNLDFHDLKPFIADMCMTFPQVYDTVTKAQRVKNILTKG